MGKKTGFRVWASALWTAEKMKKKILTKKEIDDIIGSLKDMTFLKDIKANPFFDEWNILGLHPSASIKEIKKRHRELSMIHHPDTGRRS